MKQIENYRVFIILVNRKKSVFLAIIRISKIVFDFLS